VDDNCLAMIAHQARVDYATHQLCKCQAALQDWQAHTEQSQTELGRGRVQFELTYHTQQIERWHNYLAALGPVEPLITRPE
jgi:hypothetical protein